jgi:hypothetical protein
MVSNNCSRMAHLNTKHLRLENYSSTLKTVTVLPPRPEADENDGKRDEDKVRLLLNFGEHGRELITSEIGLFFLQTLCNDNAREEFLKSFNIDPVKVNSVLDQSIIVIVPMENLHGREMVEGGNLCERKNGRGVDPNRNWDIHWGHKENDYDPSEEYPGSKPFSEPESELLRQLGLELKPHVWLNVHSGMEAMFLPYDHKNELVKGPSAEATLRILRSLNEQLCKGRCAVGPGGKTVGYLAHGTATDYMHEKLGVGISMTWEIYGKENVAYDNCFEMFNPLTKKEFDDVVGRWTGALYQFMTSLPGHPSVPELQTFLDGNGDGRVVSREDNREKSVLFSGVGEEKMSHSSSAAQVELTLGRKGGGSITRLELKMRADDKGSTVSSTPLVLSGQHHGQQRSVVMAGSLGVVALLLLLSWKGLRDRRMFSKLRLAGKRRIDKPLR